MQVHLSRLQIRVETNSGTLGTDLSLSEGLNLIRADNSAGKSTCIGSIIWVLGLDGMLGPEQNVPLPHAMTSTIDDPTGVELNVLESYVLLELKRADGAFLTVRRHVSSDEIDKKLVRTWKGNQLSNPDSSVAPVDYYVRRQGAAQEERGFHRFFAEWCGLSLPQVPRFDGNFVPLYLEAIAPLWIVEQKRGWAGIQSQTPTHLQIREVKQRALEYVLQLEALDRRARIQELERTRDELRVAWRETVAALDTEARAVGGLVRDLPRTPTNSWPGDKDPEIVISKDDSWTPLKAARRSDAEIVDSFRISNRPQSNTRGDLADDLEQAEAELERVMAAGSQLRKSLTADRATLQDARSRLGAIQQDRRRHQDLRVLRQLGSDDETLLHAESCPVCHRDLGEVLLEEGDRERVMGIEETIDYLTTQAELTTSIISSTERSLQARQAQFNALAGTARDLRSRVSSLKESLTGAGPAVAEIDAMLSARYRLERYDELQISYETARTNLEASSQAWANVEAELKQLRLGELSDEDREKLKALEAAFLSQLSRYGFASFPPDQMYLSPDTYLPTHDGYDPAFESSASDVIRIIWAYLLALKEVSFQRDLGHPGWLIFDEPRQQMAHEVSFRELLRQAAAGSGQVIFATSEDPSELAGMLEGIDSNTISFEGKILSPIRDT